MTQSVLLMNKLSIQYLRLGDSMRTHILVIFLMVISFSANARLTKRSIEKTSAVSSKPSERKSTLLNGLSTLSYESLGFQRRITIGGKSHYLEINGKKSLRYSENEVIDGKTVRLTRVNNVAPRITFKDYSKVHYGYVHSAEIKKIQLTLIFLHKLLYPSEETKHSLLVDAVIEKQGLAKGCRESVIASYFLEMFQYASEDALVAIIKEYEDRYRRLVSIFLEEGTDKYKVRHDIVKKRFYDGFLKEGCTYKNILKNVYTELDQVDSIFKVAEDHFFGRSHDHIVISRLEDFYNTSDSDSSHLEMWEGGSINEIHTDYPFVYQFERSSKKIEYLRSSSTILKLFKKLPDYAPFVTKEDIDDLAHNDKLLALDKFCSMHLQHYRFLSFQGITLDYTRRNAWIDRYFDVPFMVTNYQSLINTTLLAQRSNKKLNNDDVKQLENTAITKCKSAIKFGSHFFINLLVDFNLELEGVFTDNPHIYLHSVLGYKYTQVQNFEAVKKFLGVTDYNLKKMLRERRLEWP